MKKGLLDLSLPLETQIPALASMCQETPVENFVPPSVEHEAKAREAILKQLAYKEMEGLLNLSNVIVKYMEGTVLFKGTAANFSATVSKCVQDVTNVVEGKAFNGYSQEEINMTRDRTFLAMTQQYLPNVKPIPVH